MLTDPISATKAPAMPADRLQPRVPPRHPLPASNRYEANPSQKAHCSLPAVMDGAYAAALRNWNPNLADFSPPLLKLRHALELSYDIVSVLRLLRSTLEIKLEQARSRARSSQRRFR